MEVNQVNTLLPTAAAQQIPPDVKAKLLAAQMAQERASAPSAPYTSRAAGLLKAMQGGLGGLMESATIQNEMQAQAAHRQNLVKALTSPPAAPAGSTTDPAASTSSSTPSSALTGQGGIGSDRVVSKSHADFIASIMPQAMRISAQTGVDPRLIAAQAAHESNFGRSAPGGNLFGIKGPGTGPINTTESINGVMTPTKASFATYDSPTAAFDGYGKLISGPRYAALRQAQGLDAQLAALGKSGYATDPNYAARVGAIARGITVPSAPQGTTTAQADMPAPGATPVASNTLPPGVTPEMVSAPPQSDGTLRGDLLAAAAQHGTFPSQADMPAPGATPVSGAGLPAGITPAMWAASQNTATDGNALRRGDEMPVGSPPYVPGAVTASGVPHQLAPGAAARADSGVGAGIGGGPSNTTGLTPPPDAPSVGTGSGDPSAAPSLRDTPVAAMNGQGPDLGTTAPAVVPDPVPASTPDAPPAPSILPPSRPPSGLGTAAAPVVPEPQGSLVPPSPAPASDNLHDQLTAAWAQHDPVGAGLAAGKDVALDPIVPDPVGSLVPPAPSSPNGALQGPQSDAAAGNSVPDAPPAPQVAAGPQSDAAAPTLPPGASGVDQANAPAPMAALGAAPDAPEPSLRDALTAAMNGGGSPPPAAPPPGPVPGPALAAPAAGPAPAPVQTASTGPLPGVDDPVGGLMGAPAAPVSTGAAGPSIAPGSDKAALIQAMSDYQPSSGNGGPGSGATLPTSGPMPPSRPQALADAMAGAGTGASAPQPGPSGSPADLSKLAVGPLTPSYMSKLAASFPPEPTTAPSQPQASASALSPDAPAPGAVPTGLASAPPGLIAAMQGGQQPLGLPGDGGGDPSSARAFQLAEAMRAQGAAPKPSPQDWANAMQPGSAPSAAPAPAPAAPQGGNPLAGIPILGGMFGGGQGTPAQARDIAGQIQANPGANPASQLMAGRVMAATGGSPDVAPQQTGPSGYPAGSQQAALYALAMDPRTSPQEMQMIMARLSPTPEKISAGEGLVVRGPDGSYRNVYTQPGKDQFTYSPDGVHILNKGTGQVTTPNGADNASGGWRAMSNAERQQYGVTDGRPAFVAPNGEPHFGMPETQGQGETAEAKSAGEAAAARRNDMITGAMAAPEKIARLKLLGTVLDNTQTGPLAGESGTAAAIASRLGIAPERLGQLGIDPNQAVNNAIANKLAGEMTMGSIGAKNGGMPASNFSVAERQFIEALYPNIENQAGGNRAVTDVLTAVEQRKLQVADAWAAYKDQQSAAGKPLSYENFEDGFRRAHSQDNIFAPIIAKYQAGGYTPTAPNPGGVPGAAPQAPGGAPQPTQGGTGQGGPSMPPQPAPSAQGQGTGAGGGYLPGAGRGAPPLGADGGAPRGAPQGQGADPLSQARAAIAAGAPRAAVIQRLQGMGINAVGL